MTIDGRLDEPAWQRAETVSTFFPFRPKNPARLSSTVARLLWDEQHIYVSYELDDDDLRSFSDEHDAILSGGDVAELMLKPNAKDTVYHEFLVAPNSTLFDCRYPRRGDGFHLKYRNWESGATVATTMDGTDNDQSDVDRGYTVEMSIPVTAFDAAHRPADGVTWSFGVFRYDYSKSFAETLLTMSIPESPRDGFHYYEGYRPLRFTMDR